MANARANETVGNLADDVQSGQRKADRGGQDDGRRALSACMSSQEVACVELATMSAICSSRVFLPFVSICRLRLSRQAVSYGGPSGHRRLDRPPEVLAAGLEVVLQDNVRGRVAGDGYAGTSDPPSLCELQGGQRDCILLPRPSPFRHRARRDVPNVLSRGRLVNSTRSNSPTL